MKPMRTACTNLVLGLVLVLAGCANVAKVGPGDTVVADRLAVKLDAAWNHVNVPGLPGVVWTQEGLALDALQFWVGVKDGQPLAPAGKDQRPLTFRATMEPQELVALFQGAMSRDGSTFTLDKLEPATFLGGKGFRFQYTLVRKSDEVKLSGVGWGAVRGSELHAMTFNAPRLAFFPRHVAKVEQVAANARLK
jgi:hypothetical protein